LPFYLLLKFTFPLLQIVVVLVVVVGGGGGLMHDMLLPSVTQGKGVQKWAKSCKLIYEWAPYFILGDKTNKLSMTIL
jgi:hypothetical protein